jgi:hypothetical protein
LVNIVSHGDLLSKLDLHRNMATGCAEFAWGWAEGLGSLKWPMVTAHTRKAALRSIFSQSLVYGNSASTVSM